MSYAAYMPVHIKPEPREVEFPPLPANRNTSYGGAGIAVKWEPDDATQAHRARGLLDPTNTHLKTEDALAADPVEEPRLTLYTLYQSAAEIEYAPENALKEGLKMVETVQESLKKLELGSKLRQDVWNREIESLQGQGAPTTLIAVCGATGAGKSSILNAVLDDNIVPTSGMRACTAVVTELAYHNKRTIDADVSFLSEAEWRQELAVLLHDLVDGDGNIKRTTDLKSDAGIAWQKVHAVYPTIAVEQLVKMSVNDIIQFDARISKILGEVKKIVSKDSKAFGKEIAKYIDSKDQKRGEKKDKKKPQEKSLMDKVRAAAGTTSSRSKDKQSQSDADAPALWPLIRQVNVRCPAKALSTGAVLVDLPGVADANAARNNIAKDYMKKCDCIWILAPITRAVDDKTARDLLGDAFKMQLMSNGYVFVSMLLYHSHLISYDCSRPDGNYDDHCITFIASKCDDISCSEVIHALNLHDDPELEKIEERIKRFNSDISEHKKNKNAAEKSAKAIDAELKDFRARFRDHNAHLEALKNGETYVSTLSKPAKSKEQSSPSGKKRKNSRKGKKGSPKRHRSLLSDEDDDSFNSSSSSSGSDDSDSDNSGSDSNDGGSGSEDDERSDSGSEDEETEESLNEKIQEIKAIIKASRETLTTAKDKKSEEADRISSLEKQLARVQKEKNAFCSLKRSDFSRDVLKEDFRTGLKDLDDAAAEERDPENFDPDVNRRNYEAIDLPVFTCSSRDYIRLKGQVKGDGEPSCFSNVKDTGIPELQEWCHQLTIASRERAARNFLSHLTTFAKSVQSYVQGIGDVTAIDRESLRERWESRGLNNDEPAWNGMDMDNDPFNLILGGLGGGIGAGAGLYNMNKPVPKVDHGGQPVGITPRLCMEFSEAVDQCVEDLQQNFKDGLEEKCRVGAANAADAAVTTAEEFAASMHWGTYRATLRRHGTWRRDLNVELVTPFTRNIAHSWSAVFESDLFSPFETATINTVNKLLKEVEQSAAPGLKDRTKLQGDACLEEARLALQKTIAIVKETMSSEQKETSRCMAPHVQAQLRDAYDRAMEERGTGSVARQKAYFRGYVDDNKHDIFEDGAEVLMDRLTKAAQAIGEALDESLGNLAQKIEVNLAVLWEGTRDNPAQMRARKYVIDIVSDIQNQIKLWLDAARIKKEGQDALEEDVVMGML